MAHWKFHIQSIDVDGKAVCGSRLKPTYLLTAAQFSRVSAIVTSSHHLCAKCVEAYNGWQCSRK